ncbi:oxidoreductase [Roseobacter weihaiensis]|uniref:oxidoreductase n=1 Tax=Roseobacter weihaiensis TaxID=2763262 RepID=UPI001D0A99FB|nr:FAD-dependent oxidoreductase [Roseobacter sp. H9]
MNRPEQTREASRRDPRYDILFEPVQIGPVQTRNRFYQVPHCNGMGHQFPSSMAEMRGVKAEGGWGVVCTEQVEIHHTSELTPIIEGRLWDDADLPVFQRMTDKIHEHGSLAGIEPCYDGLATPNRYSREVPMAPSARPVAYPDPVQARAMDKTDIRNLRRWYVEAAKRSKRAGFDIIYVYAGHDLNALSHFLSRRWNDRGDEYGGSLENRARLLREVLSDTKDAVGDTCGVAIRFGVEEMMGSDGLTSAGEGRDVVEMLADIPDLWDVNVSDWDNDSMTSRFAEEGFQDDHVAFVKKVTQKPVVGVGRYTSPDKMVSLITSGALDLIGAARPSIADPFLPRKIQEGRIEDIRECIGCNICVTADFTSSPLRCTQNPTMGEEWRRGWHPERIDPRHADETVLIVGGGPSGLEAARALGARGYGVTLAEATAQLGGRVLMEGALPGLAAWRRVADYRTYQISQMANVETYLESPLTANQVLEFGADHVVIATGATWCESGVGRENHKPIARAPGANVLAVEAVAEGAEITGPVVLFDDDHFYMGGVLAELLRRQGHEVTLVTPMPLASYWTQNTLEQERIQARLLEMGIGIVPLHNVTHIGAETAEIACVYTERTRDIACRTFVPVTMRRPVETLYHEVQAQLGKRENAPSLTRIGDCFGPGTIAAAVYAGHRYARELGDPASQAAPFRRELPRLADLNT